ncbi:SH3 domain-containing protein [Pseudovibrio japonicus]
MGPSTDYDVIRVLEPDSIIMVRSCQSDWRWCLVSYHGIQGYVSARYIHRNGIDVNTGTYADMIPINDSVEYHEAYYLR